MHASRPMDSDQDGHPGLTAGQRARREAILSATSDLLDEREHGQIHMRDIAERSGVALATLYRYFASKELLYAHTVVAWGDAFGPATQRKASTAASDRERIHQAFRRTIKAYERQPAFYRLIAALEVTEDREAHEVFQAFSGRYQALLRDVLSETDDDDAALIAQMLLATLGSALRKWSLGDWPVARVYDQMASAVDLMFRAPRAA